MLYLEEAVRVLLANKVRSLLTITGLIIGVGAVIAIQVLGSGMSGAVQGALAGFSDKSFIVQPNAQQGNFRKAALRLSDVTSVTRNVPNIVEGVPFSFLRQQVRAGHAHSTSSVFTATARRFDSLSFTFGRAFTADQVAQSAAVCVLSDAVYHRLFPSGGDPTGQSIHIGTHRYVIEGVQTPPRTGILNANQGGDIALPYTTFERDWLQGRRIFAGVFYVADAARIDETELAAIRELRRLHKNAGDIQYLTFDRKTFTSFIDTLFAVLTLIVGLIGLVSLLVAGIGIMNIMLVSVTERTREIGIRKAIGARRNQILIQFFIEALLLCGVGCAIGLALGLGVGYAVNALALVKLSGVVTALPWVQASLITLAFTVVVTLAFGTYPAYRAAALDPIEALRYE